MRSGAPRAGVGAGGDRHGGLEGQEEGGADHAPVGGTGNVIRGWYRKTGGRDPGVV